jgi:serine/threonine-protein kinase
LLTNHAPAEAKQRFLKPQSLARPRDLNPAISEGMERGILNAIEMHPDDRPNNIIELRTALFANAPPAPIRRASAAPAVGELLRENALWFALAGVSLLAGFVVTLTR